MSRVTRVREEYEVQLEPLLEVSLERRLPLSQRLWQQGWLRKGLILALLALAWELAARVQGNDLLLPGFLQTARALGEGLASGELPAKAGISLLVLFRGYLLGIVLAFVLTSLAVSTQLGRDLLGTLTAMFNPLPAIALLPLALLWFGLGQNSLIFVLVHSVLWALALNTYAGFLGVSETLRMAGRNYGLRGLRFVLLILVPAALPSILAGLKIGWAFAWRTLIAAELVFGEQRQGRARLVHFPEPQRAVHRQGIRRPGRGGADRPAGGEPGVRQHRAPHGEALGSATLGRRTGGVLRQLSRQLLRWRGGKAE